MQTKEGAVLRRFLPLAILVALMSIALVACGDDGDTPTVQPTAVSPAAPAPAPTDTPTAAATKPASTLPSTPSGRDKSKDSEPRHRRQRQIPVLPSDLTFKVGEKVEFTLLGETEFHTFTVDDLGIDESLDAGEEVVFTFTFDTAGTFDLICLAHPQMTGAITVE